MTTKLTSKKLPFELTVPRAFRGLDATRANKKRDGEKFRQHKKHAFDSASFFRIGTYVKIDQGI